MKNIITLVFLYLSIVNISGQGIEDEVKRVIRFSTLDYASTARTIGISSALTALGGESGILNINPAGIGDFGKSEFNIGFGVQNSEVDAKFGGYFKSDGRNTSSLNHLSLIFHNTSSSNKVKNNNFAIGYQKIADYNEYISYNGETKGTIIDRFLQQADGLTKNELDDFEAWPAYYTGAIYDLDSNLLYESDFDGYTGKLPKSQTIHRTGYMSELSFAFSQKMSNDWNWGVSLNIPIVKYNENRFYTENDNYSTIDAFNSLNFDENTTTEGGGINMRIGMNYKLNKSFRIGASIQTPTLLRLKDTYQTTMKYSYDDKSYTYPNSLEDVVIASTEYDVTTPWRYNLGLAYLFTVANDIKGFISADIEGLNYANGNFSFTDQSKTNNGNIEVEKAINDKISKELNSIYKYKIGGEIAFKHFRGRLGTSFSSSEQIFENSNRYNLKPSYSIGLGYRTNTYYIDLGFVGQEKTEIYTPYVSDYSRQDVAINSMLSALVVSFGLKLN